jgi:hypothetical protein
LFGKAYILFVEVVKKAYCIISLVYAIDDLFAKLEIEPNASNVCSAKWELEINYNFN